MAIIYANSRFTKKYKKPTHLVMGQERGNPFRRIFSSESFAKRFFNRMRDRPYISLLSIQRLP